MIMEHTDDLPNCLAEIMWLCRLGYNSFSLPFFVLDLKIDAGGGTETVINQLKQEKVSKPMRF